MITVRVLIIVIGVLTNNTFKLKVVVCDRNVLSFNFSLVCYRVLLESYSMVEFFVGGLESWNEM